MLKQSLTRKSSKVTRKTGKTLPYSVLVLCQIHLNYRPNEFNFHKGTTAPHKGRQRILCLHAPALQYNFTHSCATAQANKL